MEKQKILSFGLTAILVAGIIFISGCIGQQAEKPPEAPPEKPAAEQPAPSACPASCDDVNACTKDYCSVDTNYECKNDLITPCCGNDVCESDESYESCPKDCPKGAEAKNKYADVSAAEAKELIEKNPDLVIIDVSQNYAQGHIPNAVNYPSKIPDLDKNGKYLVYCHSDASSIAAAQLLVDAGFRNVFRLDGNYKAWVDAGYEIEPEPSNETGIAQNKTEIKENKTYPAGVISADELSMHNNIYDCWVAYEGNVYDITDWLADKSVRPRCGTSNPFDNIISRYDVAEIKMQGVLKGTLQSI